MSETTTAPAETTEQAPTLTEAVAARIDSQAPPQEAPEAPAAPKWDGKVESLPEDVQSYIRDLRKQAGDERIASKALAAIQGVINPKAADEKPDPAALTEQLTASQRQARQASVELAVFRTAATTGADPDALLDSRAFAARIDALDPSAEDFTTQISTAIAETLAANPKLKAGRAPGASSVDHSAGGPGEGRAPRKPRPLHQSVSGVYGV